MKIIWVPLLVPISWVPLVALASIGRVSPIPISVVISAEASPPALFREAASAHFVAFLFRNETVSTFLAIFCFWFRVRKLKVVEVTVSAFSVAVELWAENYLATFAFLCKGGRFLYRFIVRVISHCDIC